ncbi:MULTISPECIES: hypothetical protein [unclassified Pseudomonas]|uniref:hypothetical protein n=1 Tax=unclassified Pseudomonas TaxID=196821 RepID=UPI0030D7AD3B
MSRRLDWLARHLHHRATFPEGQGNGDEACLIALDGERLGGGAAQTYREAP